ncbi:MAG: hypothetical protein NVSMB9_29070 [Isosphaeraceae bacterium]
MLQQACADGVDLAVLPEMFHSGYGQRVDYAALAETVEGPFLSHLRRRSRQWRMSIAAGFVEREGAHLYDSLAYITPEGETQIYRKRNLVFWERFRFQPGNDPLIVNTPWGRIGFAICADMLYQQVWSAYRQRIDLALISAAWPDFACRHSGRKHWLLGHVGPLSAEIPTKVAHDLRIPVVFANQCGETRTIVPLLGAKIEDRFAGKSSISDGTTTPPVVAGTCDEILLGTITLRPQRGSKTCHFMFPLVSAVSSFDSGP